jgi:Co/Zn/Cd efflux system component
VGVIISTLLIQFYGWTGFDPIASLFIAILIAASVIPLVMDTGKVLALDVAERDVDIQKALNEVCSFLFFIHLKQILTHTLPSYVLFKVLHPIPIHDSGPKIRQA